MRANLTHQPLGHHHDQRRSQDARVDAQIEHSINGRCGIIGMQSGQYEVTGDGGP